MNTSKKDNSTIPGFYLQIESIILLDNKVSDKSKLLYGVISALSRNKAGYAYMTYKQYANILNIKERRLYDCIKELERAGYILKIKQKFRTYLKPAQDLKPEMINRFASVETFDYDWLKEEE